MTMRHGWLAIFLAAAATVSAATLEKLALDEMIAKSTEIVRGKVTSVGSTRRGAVIYTQARVAVSERLKGAEANIVDVNIPGGIYAGMRQTFSGAPQVQVGSEYVFFLWAGPSGNRQIIGLSQGLLDLKTIPADGSSSSGQQVTVERAPIHDTLLDPATRRAVDDDRIAMPLSELRSRVQRVLGAAKE